MAARNSRSSLCNERGTAMVETVPLLIIFVVLLGFGLGFFGVVHTAIMNSMAARAYTFETFRNRADLTIHRDNDGAAPTFYLNYGARFHTINDERIPASVTSGQYATARNIEFGHQNSQTSGNVTDHNSKIYTINGRNNGVETSPAWVMVGYGMCLNLLCGDNQ